MNAWPRRTHLHTRDRLVAIVCADGRRQAKWQCECGATWGGAVKMVSTTALEALPVARVNPPRTYPRCGYDGCDAPGVEEHHYAPRHIFGEDAWRWPTGPLCAEHHRQWHTRLRAWRARTAARLEWDRESF